MNLIIAPVKEDTIEVYIGWKNSYAKRAAIHYKIWLTRFYAFIGKSIEEVTLEDLTSFVQSLEGKYAAKTRQYAVTILKDHLRWLRLTKRVDIPFELLRKPSGGAEHYKPLKPKDFQLLVDAVKKEMGTVYKQRHTRGIDKLIGLRNLCILHVLWDTGIRREELRSLNIEHIDLDDKSALILCVKSKGRKRRRIFWSETTNELLKEHIKNLTNQEQEAPVFVTYCSANRGRVSNFAINKIIDSYSKKAGIKVSPHNFRVGWATERHRQEVDLRSLQIGLGHSSIKTTQSYIQPEDYEVEARLRKVLV